VTKPPPSHWHTPGPEDVLRRKVKAELRKRIRGLRSAAPADACAARSARIVERLEAHPAIGSARGVALFWPIVERHEVDLRALDARLRARGARVAYPAIDPETRRMAFRWTASASELEERGLGFAEPAQSAPECARGELDAVVVPALVLAPSGHRIGYGGGYYDRALPDVAPPAVAIGVGYDYQLLAEVPATEGDVPLDAVVTDLRALAVAGASK
jgi:5-formyltetrahydrofolate cyclo-ligase